MDGDNRPELVALRRRRESVIEQLSDAFARDVVGLDDYEQRVTLAHRAASPEDLDALVADLGPVSQPSPGRALVPARTPAPLALAPEPEAPTPGARTLVAVLGGIQRSGPWRMPRLLRVRAVLGGVDLDFREVSLPPGVTELRVGAVLGGVHIVVPPTLAVECDGWAVLGGFQDLARAPSRPDPAAPLLRITGFAVLGGLDIETLLPGETAADARRRRDAQRSLTRSERRALGRAAGRHRQLKR